MGSGMGPGGQHMGHLDQQQMGHQAPIGPNQNGHPHQGPMVQGQMMDGPGQGMGRGMMMGDTNNKKSLMRQGSLGQNQGPMMGMGPDYHDPMKQHGYPQHHNQTMNGHPWPQGPNSTSGPGGMMSNKIPQGPSKCECE